MSSTARSHAAPTIAVGANVSAIRWLRVDAFMSASSGLLLAAAAPLLDALLGTPVSFLIPLGLFLLAYAGALAVLAGRGASPSGVKLVVAGNTVWVAASIAVVLADLLTLTTIGTVVALLQAGAVALVAELQLRSLRWTPSTLGGP